MSETEHVFSMQLVRFRISSSGTSGEEKQRRNDAFCPIAKAAFGNQSFSSSVLLHRINSPVDRLSEDSAEFQVLFLSTHYTCVCV